MAGGYLAGFQVHIHNFIPMEISHLFAEDTQIICDADHDQIHNLRHILLCFEAVLGLRINLMKSVLVTVAEVLH